MTKIQHQLASKYEYPLFANLAQVLVIASVATYLCTGIHFPEFYEHLTRGKWILENAELPKKYIWSVIGSNLDWSDSNWLFNIFVSWVETNFGTSGLISAKMLVCVFTVASFSILFSKISKDRFLGTIVAILVCCGLLHLAPFTAELLGWGELALLIFICEQIKSNPEKTHKRSWLLFTLLLLSIIYANTHASYGLAAFFCFSFFKGSRATNILIFAIFIVAAFANPYFGGHLLTALKVCYNHVFFDILLQRDPASIYNFSVAFLVLLWLLLALFWHYRSGSLTAFQVAQAGVFSLIGLASSYVLPISIIVIGILICKVWDSEKPENLGNLGQSISHFKRQLSGISPIGMLWVLLCITIVNTANHLKSPTSNVLLPKKEVEYLIETGFTPPLYHESFIGAYLAYRFSSEKGQLQNAVMITNSSLNLSLQAARAEFSLRNLGDDWRESFGSYAPNTVLCRQSSSLYQFLSENPDWRLLFQDSSNQVKTTKQKGNNPFKWAVFKRFNKTV
jgi:hypothetical protein